MVLEGGVIEGRKVFANIIKYIAWRSSNSETCSACWEPAPFCHSFHGPIQILTNNMLYDFRSPIPSDAVDDELVARPRPWKIGEIRRFILCIGPISLYLITQLFCDALCIQMLDPSRAPIFQTGWFVESIMTQTSSFISFARIRFLSSRAVQAGRAGHYIHDHGLRSVAAVFSLASSLGLTHLPAMYWPILLLTLLAYMGLTQASKFGC